MIHDERRELEDGVAHNITLLSFRVCYLLKYDMIWILLLYGYYYYMDIIIIRER